MMRRNEAHLSLLDRAAEDVRKVAAEYAVRIKFFGSYARRSVHPESDLDILILQDDFPEDFISRLEDVGDTHGIQVDVRLYRHAPHLARDLPA